MPATCVVANTWIPPPRRHDCRVRWPNHRPRVFAPRCRVLGADDLDSTIGSSLRDRVPDRFTSSALVASSAAPAEATAKAAS